MIALQTVILAYACTIFLSAFLLFAVQPMIGKIILPWFGGAAAVWNTCLMFFQAALLAGYLYAHWSTRYLKPRTQAILHVALIAVSLALLPVLPSAGWKPTHAGDPSGRILLLLAATIGLPYVLLSTTSPLLQAWYVAMRPGAIPYRLFALSNLGSLLALFSFPVIAEPQLTTHEQAYTWSGMYAVFVVLCAAVGWRAFRAAPQFAHAKPAGDPPPDAQPSDDAPPWWIIRLLWVALPACASALLLAFTTHLSQNVAPIPLLWVLPLGAYLLTFILCFENERVYQRAVFLPLLMAGSGATAYAIYYDQGNPEIYWAVPLFVATLFVCCMVCHGELVRLKPDPRRLTSFYLMVSLGGALGGLFVALLAPHVFHTFVELHLSLVVCGALAWAVLWIAPGVWRRRSWLIITRVAMVAFTVGLAGYLGYQKHDDDGRYDVSVRNFYGVLRVIDIPESKDEMATRRLIHGTIDHGEQLQKPSQRRTPTSYYGPDSGEGRSIRYFQAHSPVRVGVVGLGAGVTAAYCRPGDYFRFYEINPLDLSIATTWFTFFNDCPGDHQVYLGDARLSMEQQPSQQFDVLAIDAFTSDAIPVHLLTREAFVVYFRHIKAGGILAVHVSNRYLDLVPVVARNAQDLGKIAMDLNDDGESEEYYSSSDWVLVSGDREVFKDALFKPAVVAKARPSLRPWTDDYSNLIQILAKK
ncbi:MAG: fused MFS/spermidine synthase [Acidobacteriia bacterium]|nr:fused MFS/spermidine synthase [Terriglobia bacterium]